MNNTNEPENLSEPEAEAGAPAPETNEERCFAPEESEVCCRRADCCAPEFDAKPVRKIFSHLGWGLAAMMGITVILQIVVMSVGSTLQALNSLPEWFSSAYSLVAVLPLYVIGVPLFYLVVRKMPKDASLKSRGISAKGFFAALLVCFTAMIAGNIISLILMGLINSILPYTVDNPLIGLLGGGNPWINALTVCIFAPVFEELVFRKILLDRISYYGDGVAIVISGVLFGLFHGNLYQLLYAALLGMVFAWVYLRSGKITLPIILHMIINFLGSVLAPYLVSLAGDLEAVETDTAAILENGLEQFAGALPLLAYEVLLFGAAIAGLVLVISKRKKLELAPGSAPIPRGKRFFASILNAGMIVFIIAMLAMFALSFIQL